MVFLSYVTPYVLYNWNFGRVVESEDYSSSVTSQAATKEMFYVNKERERERLFKKKNRIKNTTVQCNVCKSQFIQWPFCTFAPSTNSISSNSWSNPLTQCLKCLDLRPNFKFLNYGLQAL